MLHEDRTRAGSFGEDAAGYDRARPTYPPALIDDLLAGVRRVLDVGCGTGIATRLFAERGAEVTGVEPDARMAAVARGRGLTVEVATFEGWDPAGRRFDLVTAAQAWHWVDPLAGASKAADVLEPGGRVGLFWNHGSLPDPIDAEVAAVYREVAPERRPPAYEERFGDAAGGLDASGRFEAVEVRTFAHRVEYSTRAWRDLLPTRSDHRRLGAERLARLLEGVGQVLDRHGGRFPVDYTTTLVTARRAR